MIVLHIWFVYTSPTTMHESCPGRTGVHMACSMPPPPPVKKQCLHCYAQVPGLDEMRGNCSLGTMSWQVSDCSAELHPQAMKHAHACTSNRRGRVSLGRCRPNSACDRLPYLLHVGAVNLHSDQLRLLDSTALSSLRTNKLIRTCWARG